MKQGVTMSRSTILSATGIFIMLSLLSGCNRDHDQTTPVGQQQGQNSTAKDYPSTRNSEQPNPAVGGNNSATNQQAPPTAAKEPPAGSGTR
jgi:hypothetical protein